MHPSTIAHSPLLSVVVPVFNEEATVLTLLKAVESAHPQDKEIIVVNDASTDGTASLLEKWQDGTRQRVLTQNPNQGKGAALRAGFAACQGRFVLIQDADLEYDPADYGVLLEPLLQDKADVVYGSRFLRGGPRKVLPYWHMTANRLLTLFSNMCTNLNLTDMETCYKVFRREVIQAIRIEENRFGVEPEITAKLARMTVRIYEVGISYHGRTHAQGKKIHFKDGIRAIYSILKYNFFRRTISGL